MSNGHLRTYIHVNALVSAVTKQEKLLEPPTTSLYVFVIMQIGCVSEEEMELNINTSRVFCRVGRFPWHPSENQLVFADCRILKLSIRSANYDSPEAPRISVYVLGPSMAQSARFLFNFNIHSFVLSLFFIRSPLIYSLTKLIRHIAPLQRTNVLMAHTFSGGSRGLVRPFPPSSLTVEFDPSLQRRKLGGELY